MSFKDHLPKAMADAIFEEEEAKPVPVRLPPAPPPATAASFQQQMNNIPPSSYVPNPAPADNPLLGELRSRTSFETTPLGQQLQGVLNDLADTGLPETQKMKTALKLSHIPASNVIDTLTGLQGVLAADKQKFDAQMQAADTSEVAGRQQKMANVDSQINDLESQLNALRATKSTLQSEIQAKVHQIESLRQNYTSAFETRSSEITTQISHYQSILQG